MSRDRRLRGPISALGTTAALALAVTAGASLFAQTLPPDMAAGWRAYLAENDRQVAAADASSDAFLFQEIFFDDPVAVQAREAVRRGEVFVTKVTLVRHGRFPLEVPNAQVHHWIGTVKVPGATLDDVLRVVQDFEAYPRYFEEIDVARTLSHTGETFRVQSKVHRTMVITVHYDMVHDIRFERHGSGRASQHDVVSRIAELENAGKANEREKAFGEDRGFLWRLVSNWRYQEQDDGVVIETEVISLSRRAPRGLGWLVAGFVESVPRDSLEKALGDLRDVIVSRR